MKRLSLFLVILVLFAGLLCADYYIKQKQHTDPVTMMGQTQPAKDSTVETWIGDNRAAIINKGEANNSIILKSAEKKMYFIDHSEKTYVEMDLPLNIDQYMPEQARQMTQMMTKNMEVTVTPTGETKKIGNWNCKGYDVNMKVMMMDMKMKVWATEDVPFDLDKANKIQETFMQVSGSYMNEKVMNEFKKIKGYNIASNVTVSVMGADVKTTTQVEEITKKEPPSFVYKVPENYTKSEKLPVKQQGR